MVDNPNHDHVGEEVIIDVDVELEDIDHNTFFSASLVFYTFSDIFYLSVAAIGGLKGSLSRLWARYFPRILTGEEADGLPRSTLKFIFAALFAFAQMKSQAETGFPFKTHPHAIMVAVTSLHIFGLTFLAEHFISTATGVDGISFYVNMGKDCFYVYSGGIVPMLVLFLIIGIY